MWVDRALAKALPGLASTFPVVVLTGPRQVGKTSLAERVFAGHTYVSLDVGAHAEMAETRPDEFLRRYPAPALFDEVQNAPGLFRHIKTAVDTRRGDNGLFVLTGSQSFPLMQSVSESLAGRAAVVPLWSLSGRELSASPVAADAEPFELLFRGGYPALWSPPGRLPDRDRWYQGYVTTYLERDVRRLLDIRRLRDFERFMRACAARTGQTLNMSDLGRDVGVSATTARAWVSVLEASGQIWLLEPYYRSLGKRLTKSPKLYLSDTGLAAYLMGYGSAEAARMSRDAGALWETWVVGQWRRWRDWHRPSASMWYWRDKTGNEVDLLLETGDQLTAIECKLAARPRPRDTRGLDKLRDFYGADRVRSRSVACTTTEPYEIRPGIIARSGWAPWPLP